jgi:histidine ammonia-lyase
VLAVEVYTAARGIEMRAPLAASPATAAVIAELRKSVPGPGTDRYLSPEIDAVVAMAGSGALVAAAESVAGPLA